MVICSKFVRLLSFVGGNWTVENLCQVLVNESVQIVGMLVILCSSYLTGEANLLFGLQELNQQSIQVPSPNHFGFRYEQCCIL